jgi:hypothetical protein
LNIARIDRAFAKRHHPLAAQSTGINMERNESASPNKERGSLTTFKAMGVEFSGPSWVALVFFAAVIVVGIIYLSEHGSNGEASAEEATAESAPVDNASAGDASTEQPASSATTVYDASTPEASTEQPATSSESDAAK